MINSTRKINKQKKQGQKVEIKGDNAFIEGMKFENIDTFFQMNKEEE